MVAYHDDEWGVPVNDDTELFERLALESFQAGLSWSTILRKRAAFRAAFRGLRPAVVVAAFDDDDRARLMADAGIVRNRREDRCDDRERRARCSDGRRVRLVRRVPRDARAGAAGPAAADAVAGDIPATTAVVRRAVGRPAPARLPVRRLDDRVRVHAERRARRRPPARVLPLRGGS